MKRNLVLIVLLLFAAIALCDCTSTNHEKVPRSVSSGSGSLHNYDAEMMAKALKKHPDFPKLSPGETKKMEVSIKGNKIMITYSSKISVSSAEGSNNLETGGGSWSEATEGTYFITLKKVWKTDQGDVESYWKYEYDPQSKRLKLIDSKNN
jgi:hypothetical protein